MDFGPSVGFRGQFWIPGNVQFWISGAVLVYASSLGIQEQFWIPAQVQFWNSEPVLDSQSSFGIRCRFWILDLVLDSCASFGILVNFGVLGQFRIQGSVLDSGTRFLNWLQFWMRVAVLDLDRVLELSFGFLRQFWKLGFGFNQIGRAHV